MSFAPGAGLSSVGAFHNTQKHRRTDFLCFVCASSVWVWFFIIQHIHRSHNLWIDAMSEGDMSTPNDSLDFSILLSILSRLTMGFFLVGPNAQYFVHNLDEKVLVISFSIHRHWFLMSIKPNKMEAKGKSSQGVFSSIWPWLHSLQRSPPILPHRAHSWKCTGSLMLWWILRQFVIPRRERRKDRADEAVRLLASPLSVEDILGDVRAWCVQYHLLGCDNIDSIWSTECLNFLWCMHLDLLRCCKLFDAIVLALTALCTTFRHCRHNFHK